MAVLALNQRQLLVGTQFVATFTGVAYDDALVVSIDGEDVVFNESSDLPFLSWQSRTGNEVRLLVLTDRVPSSVETFSFQIRAGHSAGRAWLLNEPNSQESYQNYETMIDAGKTLELLEFGRQDGEWSIRTKHQEIGATPLPEEEKMYPEHLRALALAARGANKPGWSSVQVFVEVNEISLPNLLSQLYLDALSAAQALSAVVKLLPMNIGYGTFGDVSVAVDARVDEAHRAQVKALTNTGYVSSKPTVEQLRARVASMQNGGVLVALVNTVGGFDVDEMSSLLAERGCSLLLLAMRQVPFGILPNLGEEERLRAFAVANLNNPTPKTVIDLLRTGR